MSTSKIARIGLGLFGRTRFAILILLFKRSRESFYLRELARIVGTGLGAVQRELRHLERIGVVRRTPANRRVYYSADERPDAGQSARVLLRRRAVSRLPRTVRPHPQTHTLTSA